MSTSTRPALFLSMRVKLKDERHHIRIPLPPIALYVLHYLLLSLDPLFAFIPDVAGIKPRLAKDTLHACILGMMAQGANEYVNVDLCDGPKTVKVRIKTF